jgi:hypothetical protein
VPPSWVKVIGCRLRNNLRLLLYLYHSRKCCYFANLWFPPYPQKWVCECSLTHSDRCVTSNCIGYYGWMDKSTYEGFSEYFSVLFFILGTSSFVPFLCVQVTWGQFSWPLIWRYKWPFRWPFLQIQANQYQFFLLTCLLGVSFVDNCFDWHMACFWPISCINIYKTRLWSFYSFSSFSEKI